MVALIIGIICLSIILYVEGRKEKSNGYVIIVGALIWFILIIAILVKGIQFLFSPAPVETHP